MNETAGRARGRWRRLFESGATILDRLSKYGILIAIVVFLWTWDTKRVEAAWGTLYSARGQGGDGGRIAALELLHGKGMSLHGLDLSKAYLGSVRLRGADLAAADLSRTDLSGADLREADLTGANLEGADLRTALLVGADLSEARLESALFAPDLLQVVAAMRGAHLEGQDLREVELEGLDLRGLHLDRTDLRGVDLREVSDGDLSGCSLRDCDLRGANLSGMRLHDVRIQDIHIEGTNLENAHITISDTASPKRGRIDLAHCWDRATRFPEASELAPEEEIRPHDPPLAER